PFGWWNIIAGIVLWLLIFNSGIHATIAGVLFAFTIPKSRLINWENKLHHIVNFIIIPLFVLANTAILLPSSFAKNLFSAQSIGIIAGLLIGKPIGILCFCWLTVKLKFGSLSENMNWRQLTGLGILASIGFTMSIFISMLAFQEDRLQDIAKTSVMVASMIAIVLSYIWFRWLVNSKKIIGSDIVENDPQQNPS
ncbi:MAG: Na+/H+ antiporter NhaA, partial [Bacteroidota bacterium]